MDQFIEIAVKKLVHQILQNYSMSRGYKQSVAQLSKLLADYAERLRNNSQKCGNL